MDFALETSVKFSSHLSPPRLSWLYRSNVRTERSRLSQSYAR